MYVPPFGLIDTVGFVLSILEICNCAVALFPAESVPSAYIVPFAVTVTVVAFAVLALPNPAFLFAVIFFPYVTVAITFPFVHDVGVAVIDILLSATVFAPTVNALDTFTVSALFPALSVTFVHK